MAHDQKYNVIYRLHGETVGQPDVYDIDEDLKRKRILPETYVDLYAVAWMSNKEIPLGLTYRAKTIAERLYFVRDAIRSTRRKILENGKHLESFAEEIKLEFEGILKEDAPTAEIPVPG